MSTATTLDLDALRARAQAAYCVWCSGSGIIKALSLPYPQPDHPCSVCNGTGHPELVRDVLVLLDEIARLRDQLALRSLDAHAETP